MNALNAEGGGVIKSRLLLKMAHTMFVRQWRFLAAASVPYAGANEVRYLNMFFTALQEQLYFTSPKFGYIQLGTDSLKYNL